MRFRITYATRYHADYLDTFMVDATSVAEALSKTPECLQDNVVRMTIEGAIEAKISYVRVVRTVCYTCVCGHFCEVDLQEGEEAQESYKTGCCGATYHIWIEDDGEAHIEQVCGTKAEYELRTFSDLDSSTEGDPFLPDWTDD